MKPSVKGRWCERNMERKQEVRQLADYLILVKPSQRDASARLGGEAGAGAVQNI
jgi:hypothetical protein